MRIVVVIFIIFLLSNCSKQKTVLICGDHVCVNKAEAEQFFEENLSIEVKIVDKKIKKELDLVEINLRDNEDGKRKVNISSKKSTNQNIKILSNKEINKIKNKIKLKKKEKENYKKNCKKKTKKKYYKK